MQQYKSYTFNLDVNTAQKLLLKYDGNAGGQGSVESASELLRSHISKETIFSLIDGMGVKFTEDGKASYSLEDMSKLSFVEYQESAGGMQVTSGIELGLNRFTADTSVTESSYMFVTATVRTAVVPYQDLGDKLSKMFGANNYYAVEDDNGVVIKSDSKGASTIIGEDYRVLSFLGFADMFAPKMLRQRVLEKYLFQDDNEKTIIIKLTSDNSDYVKAVTERRVNRDEKAVTVKLTDRDIKVVFEKDKETGSWYAHVPEIVSIDTLNIITPEKDKEGKELSLSRKVQEAPHKVDMLTELDVYAIRSASFPNGFNKDVFKEYAKRQQKAKLLPAWAELIAGDKDKYKVVLEHYQHKFNLNMLENPLYFVSFMHHIVIPFEYNQYSIHGVYLSLVNSSEKELYGSVPVDATESKMQKLQQKLLQENRFADIVFARHLNRYKDAAKTSSKSKSLPSLEYRLDTLSELLSPATTIVRAARRSLDRYKDTVQVIRLQSLYRAHVARSLYKKNMASIVKLEALIRGHLQFSKYKEVLGSVLAKEVIGKTTISPKLIDKNMQSNLILNPEEAFGIVNDKLDEWYQDYLDMALRSIKAGNTSNIDAAYKKFSTRIENLHAELKSLLHTSPVAPTLIVGEAQILELTRQINNALYVLVTVKNDAYMKYISGSLTEEKLVESLGGLVQKFNNIIGKVKNTLVSDSIAFFGSMFEQDSKDHIEVEGTTVTAILTQIEKTSVEIYKYLYGLPNSKQVLELYSSGIKDSLSLFRENTALTYSNYKWRSFKDRKRVKEAIKKHNAVIQAERKRLRDEITLVVPHVQDALRSGLKTHDRIVDANIQNGSGIFIAAASIIRMHVRAYFKTDKHKKRMFDFYKLDSAMVKLKAELDAEAVISYQKVSLAIVEQLQVRTFPANRQRAASLPVIKSDLGSFGLDVSGSYVDDVPPVKDKAKSRFGMIREVVKGGFSLLKYKKSINNEEQKHVQMQAVPVAEVLMPEDVVVSPKPDVKESDAISDEVVKKPTSIEKLAMSWDTISSKDRKSLYASNKEYVDIKANEKIVALETAVVDNPKDKEAISQLRYLYVKLKDEKPYLTDKAIIAKAKLELVKRAILNDTCSNESDAIAVAIASSVADYMEKAIPIKPMREKKDGTVYFKDGFSWPRMLDKLANKSKGLLQSSSSTKERHIWFASICNILKQEDSLTPTIDVSNKTEEVAFIDNSVSQLIDVMSQELITDSGLLLEGLQAAIFQINYGGYKQRCKGSANADMINLLKAFNLALDDFSSQVLVRGLKEHDLKHSDGFIEKQKKLEKTFIDLLNLFRAFDMKCDAYKNKAISSQWLAIIGKIHFLAYDSSFSVGNHIGFGHEFLNYHKDCIRPQKGGNHPVRSILEKSSARHAFTLGVEQVPFTAQEMLDLAEVTLVGEKCYSNLELITAGGDKVAVVIRPHNSYLMKALLFTCALTAVVLTGLLPTLLAHNIWYALPAIVVSSLGSYKLAKVVDTEISVGSFDVASPVLMGKSAPVPAFDIKQELGLHSMKLDVDSDEEQIDVSLDVFGRP